MPKGGAGRAFNLPLSQSMQDCIRRVREQWRKAGHRDSPFLFPSATSQSGAVNDMRSGDIKTGHILRYTFSNMAKAAGVWESDVGVLMNHRSKTQTAGYHNPNTTPEHYLTQMEKISTKIVEAIGL
jgi:integrase